MSILSSSMINAINSIGSVRRDEEHKKESLTDASVSSVMRNLGGSFRSNSTYNVNEDRESLKFNEFLKNLESKLQYNVHNSKYNLVKANNSILDLIFYDVKNEKYIKILLKEDTRVPKVYDVCGCESNYKLGNTYITDNNIYEIMREYINSYKRNNSVGAQKHMIRYLFYGILGAMILDNKKYIERISDLAVCLDIRIVIIKDIVEVAKCVLKGEEIASLNTPICKSVFKGFIKTR